MIKNLLKKIIYKFMSSILKKIIEKKIISRNPEKKIITYDCKLPLFIKEIEYKNNKEREVILNNIKIIKKELKLKILDDFEEQNKIYILFYENKETIDELFDFIDFDSISLEGYIEGHSAPIKKKEINNLLSKEISICKISNKNQIGTGFFCRININEIPLKLVLFTNNHILDRNSLKIGEKIILDHKNFSTSKILEITKNRKIFTDEELDYTCIEIFEKDNILKKEEIKETFTIDQKILEGNPSSLLNNDVYLIQYPKGNEFSLSIGKIDYIDNKLIKHTASTEYGSSGAPIIRRNNYSIIGIHYGSPKKINGNEFVEYNLSTNIFSIINDIKMKLTNNISNINKKKDIIEEYKKIDKLGLIKYKSKNFILVSSIDCKIINSKFNNSVLKRLNKEMIDLKKDFLEGIQIYGIKDKKLIGAIEGPPKTSYEKGFFLFEIIISENYPFRYKYILF